MHQILALIFLAALLGGAFGFGSHVAGSVAQHGPPRAARGARAVQQHGRQARQSAEDRAREVWAQAKSADWLARRQRARDRRDARTPLHQHAGRGARWVAAQFRQRAAAPPDAGAAARVPAAPSPTGTSPPPARPASPPPAPPGRTDPVTTSPGASADLFAAVQQLTARAKAGGLRSKQQAAAALAEAFDYMQQHIAAFAADLSEPGQGYPASIWEPLTTVSAHLKAAAGSAAESSSAISALAGMTVGELAASPVRAPHHDELNKDAA